MANVTTALGEEEAGSEAALVKVFPCNRARNCGLSRAGPAIKPKYAPRVLSVNPVVDILQEFDTGVGEARMLVF
jgi:hypothetical protein